MYSQASYSGLAGRAATAACLPRRVAGPYSLGKIRVPYPFALLAMSAGFDFSSTFSLHPTFLKIFRFPAPHPHPLNSAHHPLNPSFFNTFPLHSNDTQQII
jgi:hypothetical protein